jgi:putative ABC transport system permease protein
MRDLAFAVRTLRKNLAFSLTAIVTLALGIGATTAIFSVVNAVLLRPLPYDHPDRLVIIWGELRTRKVHEWSFSPPDLKDVQDQATLFDGVAGITTGSQVFTPEGGTPQEVQVAFATTNIFKVLGVHVVRGRDFGPDDGFSPPLQPFGPPPGAPAANGPPPPRLPNIAILSDAFWRTQFGADPSIVGKTLRVGGGPPTQVVGILAPGVELDFPPSTRLARLPDMWTAARIDFVNSPRNNVGWFAIGRMKPNVTISAASAQVERVSAKLRDQFPLDKSVGLYFRAESMKENIVATVRPTIRALMGAVLFVLLIACANVANLLLVRVSARDVELAVRAAMGGSQWALTRQLLAESLVLSAAGSILGVGLAYFGISALLATAPADLPRMEGVAVNWTVLGFALVACIASALAFGLLPAIRAARPNLASALRAGGRGALGGASALLRKSVVTAEVALSFVLLVGCGLMVRSAISLQHVDPGFQPNGLLTLRVGNLRARSDTERVAKAATIRQALLGVPSVTDVATTTSFPLEGRGGNGRWGTDAALVDPQRFRQGEFHVVTPTYFSTLRARVLAGRVFTDADNVRDNRSIVIDDVVAGMAFPNESAVGKHLLARIASPDALQYEVIGVVKHLRHTTLVGDEKESIYFPAGSLGAGANGWVVRTTGDPATLATAVRSALVKLDPQFLVTNVQPESFFVDRAMAPTRFTLSLIATFAALAAVLAAIGLYGVLSSLVRQRVSEIGVRMAFGAPPSRIFRLIIGQGLGLSAIGVAVGILSAFLLTRAMANLLVGVTAWDPATYAVMVGVFLVVAGGACWIPARRAAGVDPNVALREG